MTLRGRFATITRRNSWPAEIASASQRFGSDYLNAKRHDDTEATFVVDLVERRCDQVDFAYFVLWSAFDVSFSEMHRRGWGSTAAISAGVYRVAEVAHATYTGEEKKEPSRLQREAEAIIRALTRN